ncbi:MAG: hypothetical protein JWQ98_1741 [Chlorobi bacterium]|nr:hypothetical protein [Chlorobiota bacterium]
MKKWLKELDRLLRGDATRISALRYGAVEISVGGISMLILCLGLFYGLCMSCYSMFVGADEIGLRILSTMIKVPLLFFLTLGITFPSLYIFNTLIGSRLTIDSVLQLLIASIGVMMAVLASLGPIIAFFSVSTTSSSFMLLLNVAVFSIAGVLGLRFLLRTLQRLSQVQSAPAADAPSAEGDWLEKEFTVLSNAGGEETNGTAHHEQATSATAGTGMETEADVIDVSVARGSGPYRSNRPQRKRSNVGVSDPKVKMIFRIWVVVFGLVGAQLSWVMRPFIGDGTQVFHWFGPRGSSFFEAVLNALGKIL